MRPSGNGTRVIVGGCDRELRDQLSWSQPGWLPGWLVDCSQLLAFSMKKKNKEVQKEKEAKSRDGASRASDKRSIDGPDVSDIKTHAHQHTRVRICTRPYISTGKRTAELCLCSSRIAFSWLSRAKRACSSPDDITTHTGPRKISLSGSAKRNSHSALLARLIPPLCSASPRARVPQPRPVGPRLCFFYLRIRTDFVLTLR